MIWVADKPSYSEIGSPALLPDAADDDSPAVQCIASPFVGAVDDVAVVAASTTGRATPTTTLPAWDASRLMPSATRCNGGAAGGGAGSVMPSFCSTARRTPLNSRWPRATKTVKSDGALSRTYAAMPRGAYTNRRNALSTASFSATSVLR